MEAGIGRWRGRVPGRGLFEREPGCADQLSLEFERGASARDERRWRGGFAEVVSEEPVVQEAVGE